MNDEKYSELEDRAARESSHVDEIRKLEARARVRHEIDAMRAEGKALTLTDEELQMLHSFRRFQANMRKDGESFTWQTRKPVATTVPA